MQRSVPGEVHIRILNETISDLQNRLVSAESNHGTCEQEKLLIREQAETTREKFDIELMSRDKQISILKQEISSQHETLRALRKQIAENSERSHHTIAEEL